MQQAGVVRPACKHAQLHARPVHKTSHLIVKVALLQQLQRLLQARVLCPRLQRGGARGLQGRVGGQRGGGRRPSRLGASAVKAGARVALCSAVEDHSHQAGAALPQKHQACAPALPNPRQAALPSTRPRTISSRAFWDRLSSQASSCRRRRRASKRASASACSGQTMVSGFCRHLAAAAPARAPAPAPPPRGGRGGAVRGGSRLVRGKERSRLPGMPHGGSPGGSAPVYPSQGLAPFPCAWRSPPLSSSVAPS